MSKSISKVLTQMREMTHASKTQCDTSLARLVRSGFCHEKMYIDLSPPSSPEPVGKSSAGGGGFSSSSAG
jgi:hypothetical protein